MFLSNSDLGERPAGAILHALVHEKRGVAGVKELAAGGSTPTVLRATLSRLLDLPWADVQRVWRAKAVSYGAPSG